MFKKINKKLLMRASETRNSLNACWSCKFMLCYVILLILVSFLYQYMYCYIMVQMSVCMCLLWLFLPEISILLLCIVYYSRISVLLLCIVYYSRISTLLLFMLYKPLSTAQFWVYSINNISPRLHKPLSV